MAAMLDARLVFSGHAVADQEDDADEVRPLAERASSPVVLLETMPRWIPERLWLGALRDSRLRLVEALDVAITVEDGQVVAEAVEINEFGWGANVSEAILDLQRAVAELYFQLEADEHRLGSGLQAMWGVLRHKVRSSRV
jgi:hypothetical protein